MYWLRATLPLAKTRDNTALAYLFAPTSELVRQDKEARPSLTLSLKKKQKERQTQGTFVLLRLRYIALTPLSESRNQRDDYNLGLCNGSGVPPHCPCRRRQC